MRIHVRSLRLLLPALVVVAIGCSDSPPPPSAAVDAGPSVPGGHVAIGAGWWVLRRLTGAETIPMLTHREGSRMVVTLQPPLPPPVADPVEDARRCRQALAPLIEGHVRRYPEQCVTLAFDSGSAAGREERPEETGRLFGSDAAARGDAVIEPRVVQ